MLIRFDIKQRPTDMGVVFYLNENVSINDLRGKEE
jgi:hypothetical protein